MQNDTEVEVIRDVIVRVELDGELEASETTLKAVRTDKATTETLSMPNAHSTSLRALSRAFMKRTPSTSVAVLSGDCMHRQCS